MPTFDEDASWYLATSRSSLRANLLCIRSIVAVIDALTNCRVQSGSALIREDVERMTDRHDFA
jgi:hypothetical protein